MESDALMARMALARGWISREACESVVRTVFEPTGASTGSDAALRAAGLSDEQLQNLRGALHLRRRDGWMGDWRLIRRVGLGGMGSVFEARHERTGRRAAVKILLPRLGRDREFRERFLREAKVLARISHPNVVHAFDAGVDGEFYYLAMEFIDGENLKELLDREGCLSPVRSAEVALAVAGALEAIARVGLIHRDVKPANVLLDGGGAIKLADLGLFRDDFEPRGDGDEAVVGTPHYISPEQVLADEGIDIRCDLYSLGATWYHMLIGRPPFDGPTIAKLVRAHVKSPPVPPRDIRPDVPLVIDRLVLALLEKEPARRPPSPTAVVQAIRTALASLGAGRSALSDGAPHVEAALGGARAPAASRGLRLAAAAAGLVLVGALMGGAIWIQRDGTGRIDAEPPAPRFDAVEAARSFRSSFDEVWGGLQAMEEGAVDVLRCAVPSREAWGPLAESLFPRPGARAPPSAPRRENDPSADPFRASAATSEAAAVGSWARPGAVVARARLSRAFAAQIGAAAEFDVLLKDGELVRARIDGERAEQGAEQASVEPVLVAPSDRRIQLAQLHAATVIVWTGLAFPEPLPDRGIGVAIDEGFLTGAKLLADDPAAVLPAEVRARLDRVEPAAGPAEVYLVQALGDAARERRVRETLLDGRWDESKEVLDGLLAAEGPFSLVHWRRGEWSRWRSLADEFIWTTTLFFAVPARPLDALRTRAIAVRYGFDGERELRDFRFDPRQLSLRAGSLIRKEAPRSLPQGPAAGQSWFIPAEPIDSVALFEAPVVVEGAWTLPRGRSAARGGGSGRIVIGHGRRFVALDPRGGGLTWLGDLADGRLPDAGEREPPPKEPSTVRFRVEFSEDAAFSGAPGGLQERLHFTEPAAGDPAGSFEAPGRLTIALDPGASLDELAVTGAPDPIWTAARIAELKAR